ncbi:hypothetical protein ACQKP0_20275 [Heyndrickxia sp. NPDC080065]|uniref:hypothetical protein n=1 Tax=Heyndrickxia sp. NPDC080065 TaxID=3390568 RepID=UPI003D033C7C
MSKDNRNKSNKPVEKSIKGLNSETNSLNSDNAFSENGLENESLLRESIKKGNSTII